MIAELMKRKYKNYTIFPDGSSIQLGQLYDRDGEPNTVWFVYNRFEELFTICCDYDKAYEIASHLDDYEAAGYFDEDDEDEYEDE